MKNIRKSSRVDDLLHLTAASDRAILSVAKKALSALVSNAAKTAVTRTMAFTARVSRHGRPGRVVKVSLSIRRSTSKDLGYLSSRHCSASTRCTFSGDK